jgi:hypothetical protein
VGVRERRQEGRDVRRRRLLLVGKGGWHGSLTMYWVRGQCVGKRDVSALH